MRTERRLTVALLAWMCLVTLAPRTCAWQSVVEEASRPAATVPTALPRGFFQHVLELPEDGSRKYAVFVPPQYFIEPDHKWPLLVVLHGSGEIGTDGVAPTQLGMGPYIAGRPKRFPFIAVFPQAHAMWYRGKEEIAIYQVIEDTCRQYRVDRDRIYLTGFSMGGFGTWELGVRRPDLFAALVPICGAAPMDYLGNLVNMPVWAFHGALDANVKVEGSRDAVARLKALGGSPQYTEFPQVAHNSWDTAYHTPALYKWLLSQRRVANPRTIDYTFPSGAIQVWWLAVEGEPNRKSPAHIRATVQDDGVVAVESEGVASFAILSKSEPIKVGQDVLVKWNGAVVYKGRYQGPMVFRPGKEETPAAARTTSTP